MVENSRFPLAPSGKNRRGNGHPSKRVSSPSDDVNLIRVAEGQRAEKYGVDDGENRGVCANAQGHGGDGDGCETRILSQHAEREAEVLRELVEEGKTALIAMGFFCRLDAAKFDERLAARFGGAEAAAEIVLDVELQVGFEFGGELAVTGVFVKEAGDAMSPCAE
jgi:hypothetical protein